MKHNKLKGNLRSCLYTHFHSYHISPYYHSFLNACSPPSLSSSSPLTLVSFSLPSVFHLFPPPLSSSFSFTFSLFFPILILPSIISPCISPLPIHVLTLNRFPSPLHLLLFLTSSFLCIFCISVFHILLFFISILVYILTLLQILCLLLPLTALFSELCSRI